MSGRKWKATPAALTIEQRAAVRERFKALAHTEANYTAVAKEFAARKVPVSSRTIARIVRGI